MMSKPVHLSPFQHLCLLSFFAAALLFHVSHGDLGTASHYGPPYTPTACYGNEASQFPTSNLFTAAGEAIWDNGAACGRQYLVRCINAVVHRNCNPNQTIRVRIVDRAEKSSARASRARTTMALSTTAFNDIGSTAASFVNVEFVQP